MAENINNKEPKKEHPETNSKKQINDCNNCITNNADNNEEKINDLTNCLQRLQAEFENYKKRNEEQTKKIVCNANCEFVAKLLPVLDNFKLAIDNEVQNEMQKKNGEKKNSEIKNRNFFEGIKLIYDEMKSILEENGLEKIETKNAKFNPLLHEAILSEEKEGFEKNQIIEEFQAGYTFKGKVIRHSKVKVAK